MTITETILDVDVTIGELSAGTDVDPIAEELADRAVAALVAEATLTPKPGLVDLRGSGAHDDMDVETLLRSALSLRDTFAALAAAGRGCQPSQELRERLAAIGREGEATMLSVTGGVNTHRGAIWALGLVVAAAAGAASPGSPTVTVTETLARARGIAEFEDRFAPSPTTPGSLVRTNYRVTGAQGEACAGFPHAVAAHNTLRRQLDAGVGVTEARLDALLTVIATLDDTCLLSRGGLDGLRSTQARASGILTLGGVSSPAGARMFGDFDALLTATKLSPGGSADLLSLALLLHSLERDALTPTTSPRKDT